MGDSPVPVACTLTTKDAARQVVEWADLQGQALAVRVVPDGRVMTFPVSLAAAVADLAAREADCCAFLSIRVDAGDEAVTLEVTAPTAEGRAVIDAFAPIA